MNLLVLALISVNFVGGASDGPLKSMGAQEKAGIVAARHWNNALGNSGRLKKLKDSRGHSTGVEISWDSPNTWSTAIPDKPGNFRMMKGYLDTSEKSDIGIQVVGLPKSYCVHGYRVLVYFDGDDPGSKRTATYSIAGQDKVGTDPPDSLFAGKFSSAANGENFVEFRGLHSTYFVLTAKPLASTGVNLRAPINAIQIIPETETQEKK